MVSALVAAVLWQPAMIAWQPVMRRPAATCRHVHADVMSEQSPPVSHHEMERSLLLQTQLARIRELRQTEFISPELMRKIGRTNFESPTFKKLFTHSTWATYTGVTSWNRWFVTLSGWRSISVLRAVLSRTAFVAAWATLVALLGYRLPMSPIALQLQGTAIGLLLVFRNNAAYQRLAEARALMGKIILLGREIASGAVTYLQADASDGQPSETAYLVCRYMAIFGWVFKARLRDGEKADDVMRAVLPEADVEWLLAQRAPVVAIIGRTRKLLHAQYASGHLPAHLHFKLEHNLYELYQVIGGCERLFTSPIPPTMTRHAVRSISLWLLAMPLALVGSMPALSVVFFTAATAYIFLGIEELGVQVEQPFDILPLWQICHLASRNVEEAVLVALNDDGFTLPLYDMSAIGHGPVWDSVPVQDRTPVQDASQWLGDRVWPIWQGK